MGYLLVTNDFPPKVEEIESYLYELFRQLAARRAHRPDDLAPGRGGLRSATAIPYRGALVIAGPAAHPEACTGGPTAGPDLEREAGPARPGVTRGPVGRRLDIPYGVVLHGAEVTVPGRLPVSRQLLRSVLSGASLAIAAGGYPGVEATARSRGANAPDGGHPAGRRPRALSPPRHARSEVRFARSGFASRRQARGLGEPARASKGHGHARGGGRIPEQDRPDLSLAIGGTGRDRKRLEITARRCGARASFLGRVSEEELPLLNGSGRRLCDVLP